MGCGSSSPTEPQNEESKPPDSPKNPIKKSMPETPKITIDYCEDPVNEDEEANNSNGVDATNDNFNNGNEEKSNTDETIAKNNVTCKQVSAEVNVAPKKTHTASPADVNTEQTEIMTSAESSNKDMQKSNKDSEDSNEKMALSAQEDFNTAVRFASLLVKPESVMRYASKNIHSLRLPRSLPPSISITAFFKALPYLQEIDVSENQMGPQAFRTLMLAMASNSTITSLNVANNHTDTDSAISVGKMLTNNSTLVSLDVSGNYLGKDFFSRCVGPALGSNKTLKILKCEGIGSVDFTCLMENAGHGNTITHLNLSHNTIQKTGPCLEHLISWVQRPDCSLHTLELKSFGMKDDDLVLLSKAIGTNQTISLLDLSSNEIPSTEGLFELVQNCFSCKQLNNLLLENIKPKQQCSITQGVKLEVSSSLRLLKLSGCDVTDDFITSLIHILPEHGLSKLEELNLSNNEGLSTSGLKDILVATKDNDGKSKLQRLFFCMNRAEDIAEVLSDVMLTDLMYINLRKAKMSTTAVGKLGSLAESSNLETVVLDGIKLAGSDALEQLLGKKDCSIIAISLAGCLLTDADLEQLTSAVKNGVLLHMLKLSANRLQDQGVRSLVDALLSHPTHPLKLIDLQSNQITSSGAVALSDIFTCSSHKTQIHSLNVSNNSITSDGLEALVSKLGDGKLTNLVANKQKASYGEEEMDKIFDQLAKTLGFSTEPMAECCDLPKLPTGLTVKLTGLGGFTGDLGRLLDSTAIVTDYQIENRNSLILSNVLEISSALKGQESIDCLLTKDEWNNIIGVDKEAPAWLQLADHRERALYMIHLPAAVTSNKLEGLLDMEADCNVDEVVLMKDELTRKNNGLAWILLSDKKFIQQAINFYNAGLAKVFSQSFVLSHINVKVDDEGSQQAEKAARDEMARRAAERSSDEAAHRRLIQQSYLESQARHAYRLANPAYADGRIW